MTKEEFLKESSKYYTRQELADALGVSLSTVKRILNSFNLKSKDCFKQKERKIKEQQTTKGIYGSTIKNKDLYRQKFLELYNQNLNDSDISKLLKETLSKTIHAITDDKRKYWLTQLYSRIRRTNNTIEDKTTLYNKMKLLEQFSEDGLEITVKVRDQEGKLERITHHVKI